MVYVYYNLHKKTWSIKDLKSKRVERHTDTVIILNAEFKVSQAGRARVLREQQKNVHAGVKGFIGNYELCGFDIENDFIEVTYNPYLYDSFVIKSTGEKITTANIVLMHNKKVYVSNKITLDFN